MKSRRTFIQFSIRLVSSLGIFFSPLLAVIRSAAAQVGRIILPKGTDLKSLINRNPRSLDTRNLEPIPTEQFGVMGLQDHRVELELWRLEIDGQVQEPLQIAYSELIRLPKIQRNVLLICPGVFSNFGRWEGVSFQTLLRLAKADKDVTHVTVRGPRGSYEKVQRFSISEIEDDRVFLAYAVNGKALLRKHGFPLRAVAEGYYGFDWIKYVYRVEVDRIPSGD
jgi:sulfoxide reductase catalytic subunit YedY